MTRPPRSLLGGLAAAGAAAATLAWTLASAIQPGYDPARDDLSALAATGAAHPWLTMTGEFLLGVGVVALAAGLVAALPGRDVVVGFSLLLSAGLATAIQALAREDCPTQHADCVARLQAGQASWHHTLHEATSGLAFVAMLTAPPVLARAFRRDSRWCDLATYSVVTAALGLVLLVAYVATAETAFGGISQRVFLLVPVAWIAVAGTRLARLPAVDGGHAGELPRRGKIAHGLDAPL